MFADVREGICPPWPDADKKRLRGQGQTMELQLWVMIAVNKQAASKKQRRAHIRCETALTAILPQIFGNGRGLAFAWARAHVRVRARHARWRYKTGDLASLAFAPLRPFAAAI